MAETRLTPAKIRRQALHLLRQCWLPLLITAVLLALPDLAADLVRLHGEGAAARVEQAVFAEFEAANPRPDDPAALEDWELERIAHAYFSSADIHGEQAERMWRFIGHGIDLLGDLFGAVILLGLYIGLLARLQGETESIRLFSGFRRWKTALWLKLRIIVCTYGWLLLALVPALLMPEILSYALLIPVALWARLHYALVLPCMADDPEARLSTTQYLDLGIAHIHFFTVWGLIRVLWPLMLLALGQIVLTALWLPGLSGTLLSLAADTFTTMFSYACIACIHTEVKLCKPAPVE